MTVAATMPPSEATAPKAGWGAVLLVLATIVVVTAGGWVLSALVPGEPGIGGTDVAPGTIEVGPVTVPVSEGWTVVQADPSGAGAVLSNGTGLLEIYPAPSPYAEPTQALRDYVAQVLEPVASQLTVGPPSPFAGPAGTSSVRASYQGTFPIAAHPLEGVATAAVAPTGTAVMFDGSAPQGQLLTVLDEIDAMIMGSVVR